MELMDGFQHPQAKALAGTLSHTVATALLPVSQSCLPATLIVGDLLKVTAKSCCPNCIVGQGEKRGESSPWSVHGPVDPSGGIMGA